ncbi:jiangshi [Anticarsia gemmatalis]|uniref:jiangshi n=1 Tax=Anticarsia gemmatalis TaxID=129554 RepID=UPI003F76F9E8
MSLRLNLFVCASICLIVAIYAQNGKKTKVPLTRFTCIGKPAGYYADIDTGCQVYHMCDGLGRQFSYKCPNMTLFQQRMLICDHWYMVNCSMSERDYDANLLIGQRDKPFVSDDEMRLRTPRPDILSVPPYNPYFDILREDAKLPDVDNDLDTKQSQSHFRPPTSWKAGINNRRQDTLADFETKSDRRDETVATFTSKNDNRRQDTGTSFGSKSDNRRQDTTNFGSSSNNRRQDTTATFGSKNENRRQDTIANFGPNTDNLDQAASQEPLPTFKPTPRTNFQRKVPNVTPPSIDLVPPFTPVTQSTNQDSETEESNGPVEDTVFQFIKRFDPTATDNHETAMSKSEILDINAHLPEGQVSSEEERTPRKHKNFGNNLNTFKNENDKSFTEGTRFDSVNTKSKPASKGGVPEPERVLLPPKTDSSTSPSVTTTVGPPIYYEWRWAVPAFGLVPPKENNETNTNTNVQQTRSVAKLEGKNPFSAVTRPAPVTTTPEPSQVEYNISSYFIPDYVFPLDKEHPGYESDDAETSFQVKVAKAGKVSYGENPACPQCHPAYLKPGTCEPCIVKR